MRDRFIGEAGDPPIIEHCDHCGSDIYLGTMFYMHDGVKVCVDCARQYAWAVFEEQAAKVSAQPDTPLYMGGR